jgi:hypothetical protein
MDKTPSYAWENPRKVMDMSLSITFLASVDVRVKTGEDDLDISLSITFLENFDVRVITGTDIKVLQKSNGQ